MAAHGLLAFHEPNDELPPAIRAHWIVMYAHEATLDTYRALRADGQNPMTELDAFAELLGYGAQRIQAGYDAYRDLFAQ